MKSGLFLLINVSGQRQTNTSNDAELISIRLLDESQTKIQSIRIMKMHLNM